MIKNKGEKTARAIEEIPISSKRFNMTG